MSHNSNIPEEPGQLDLIQDQLKTFIDCLHDADTMEIDGMFIGRNFSVCNDLDEDEVDPLILEINYVDDDTLDNYEWFFSQNECEEAKYKGDGVWILPHINGSGEEDGTFEIILYKLSKVTP